MILVILFLFSSTVYCLDDSPTITKTLGQHFAEKKDFESISKLDDYCMKGGQRKTKPTAEPALYQQCGPYESKSCCTYITSEMIHKADLYIYTLNFCQAPMVSLSNSCRKHFQLNLCFYECSPNIGPWISAETRDRLVMAPLCQNDCDVWFENCKNDFVCFLQYDFNRMVTNLPSNCSRNQCLKFSEAYSSAREMCEMILDNSWKVVNNSAFCMTTQFNSGRQNSQVTRRQIHNLLEEASDSNTTKIVVVICSFVLFVIFTATMASPYVARQGRGDQNEQNETE